MDAKAIRRAALITLRRAICERFPPGRERDAWLAWVQGLHDTARLPHAVEARKDMQPTARSTNR